MIISQRKEVTPTCGGGGGGGGVGVRIAVAMALAVVAGDTRSMAFLEYLLMRFLKLTRARNEGGRNNKTLDRPLAAAPRIEGVERRRRPSRR